MITMSILVLVYVAYKNRGYFMVMAALGLLYPLGKLFQFWLIGPGWIRWHLSDVGWISWLAILLTFLGIIRGASFFSRVRRGIGTAFLVALCSESLQLIFIEPRPDRAPGLTATGDWIDMVIFLLMLGVNLGLVFQMERSARMKSEERE